jgi:Na+/H+ antiporter NhaC
MFTLEIIIFILAILAGILLYWRESKSNYLYKLINRITHSKEQQMKADAKKGFFFMQPFLIRLVYMVVLILVIYLISEFLTPIRILNIKYFATLIVGTMLGTYFASLIVFANKKVESSHDIIEETIKKGKSMLKDLTEKEEIEKVEKEPSKKEKEPNTEAKKSARERLKDKGFLK